MLKPALHLCALLFLACAAPAAPAPEIPEIPFTKHVLANGLTLIVHEDHKAPIVGLSIWYHVGSKNEKPGKTGFAHLFEHLMFNGSEHYDDDWFKALEKVGATGVNGTTNEDRTNYFEVVPKDALDFALWMESDRMGHLLGAVDQARLDEQRGVVQNEKRQGENQPYGLVEELIPKSVYPAAHPYSWTVIGSMEDLDAASLEDVREWFKAYYGPSNATLAIAGDVETADVIAKVEKYFGDIPSGPPVARYESWIARRTGSQRQVAQDRVPQARLYKIWNTPPYKAAETTSLDLAADVLASGKNSRLYKRLVYDEEIASDVSAFDASSEIGGLFYIVVTAREGHDLAELETAIDEELARLIDGGPTSEELQRAKTQRLAEFIRNMERIGGWGGKADVLASSAVLGGSPDFYKTVLKRVREATPDTIRAAAREWLSDGDYVLEVQPFPEYKNASSGADRSSAPVPKIESGAKFPELQFAMLSNGLKIVLAERHAVPLVNFRLVIDAGFAADRPDARGGVRLATDLLDEGTKSRNALQLSKELDALGASLATWSEFDTTNVSLSALKTNLDPSLDLLADVVLEPALSEADFKRLQKQQLDAIRQEKADPDGVARREFPRLVYGEQHPYGAPSSGLGDEDAVVNLTVEDARNFFKTWFRADNATLIVTGDTTLAEIQPKLEKLFLRWAPGSVPEKSAPPVEPPPSSVIYLIDRPGSIQSSIVAGNIAPPRANTDEVAIDLMNDILGGSFTSRINMNLREDKHWSYGARTALSGARGPRTFAVTTAVQTDKTKESLIEIAKELKEVAGARPIDGEEFAKAQRNELLSLPGAWETIGSVESLIAQLTNYGLPEDYFATYPDKVREATAVEVNAAVGKVVRPDRLVWVVVGDRAKIESGIREANLGELRVVSLAETQSATPDTP